MSSSFDNNDAIRASLPDVTNTEQQAGEAKSEWEARVAVDYDALRATGEKARELEASGAIPIWGSSFGKYEHDGEIGVIGPSIPQVEEELFRNHTRTTLGKDIRAMNEFVVEVTGPTKPPPVKDFKDAGLHPVVLQNIQLSRYESPTPIQSYTIPAVLLGHDVIGVAQTGSGKTGAYLIPIVSKLMGKVKKLAAPRPRPSTYTKDQAVRAEPLVMIVVPTRELAIQIFEEACRMCYRSGLRPAVVYGGVPKGIQIEDLQKGCDILIGTPGRLRDIVVNAPRWLSLIRVKFTIFDEADEMINPDWENELTPILAGGAGPNDGNHQFLMFSATFNKDASQMASEYLSSNHIRINIGRSGSSHVNIYQNIIWVDEHLKKKALYDLILSLPPARTLVFVNSVGKCDEVDDYLYNQNLPVTSIHSQRTQREREDAMRAFRVGKCPIMVSSNVQGRGIDVKNIMHVINYDLPSMQHGGINEYVHRIGRTGRIGNMGAATSFYNDRNEEIAPLLVKIIMECKQSPPDFLQGFKPVDGILTWEDDAQDDNNDDADTTLPSTPPPKPKLNNVSHASNDDDGWGAPAGGNSWM